MFSKYLRKNIAHTTSYATGLYCFNLEDKSILSPYIMLAYWVPKNTGNHTTGKARFRTIEILHCSSWLITSVAALFVVIVFKA
jgi:hypothetical protein